MSQKRSEDIALPRRAGPSAPSTAAACLLSWVESPLPSSWWGFKASLGPL